MIILKLILAILLAFIVFAVTVYVLSQLLFQKVNLDDHITENKIGTSNLTVNS